MANWKWPSNDWWPGHEGQENNNSFCISETNPTALAQQPHGHREDKALRMWVGTLIKYQYRHHKHCKTLCSHLRRPINTVTWEDNTIL